MEIIKKEKYNDNNSLGFGGKKGEYIYYDNGIREFKGKYCYRHIGKSSADGFETKTPDGYWIDIMGYKSDVVFIFKITFEGDKIYTNYRASFQKNYYDYMLGTNNTTISIFSKIKL